MAEQVSTPASSAREAQRRRTRRAIVDAAARLLAAGTTPSVGEVAAAADVSRRTVYTYFPTLDQLLLDATVGAVDVDVEAALTATAGEDPRERVASLVAALGASMAATLPLGRRLIRLTVEGPGPAGGAPRRGYRRVQWIERALEPVRGELPPRAFDDLVSALAVVIGWEAYVVLVDVRGLSLADAQEVVARSARAVLDAALPRP